MNKQNITSSQPKRRKKFLKRHLVGKEDIANICDQFRINPNQYYRWQGELFENEAVLAFELWGKRDETKIRNSNIRQNPWSRVYNIEIM